jgi:tetratricopeptide (TPR) repeat protein
MGEQLTWEGTVMGTLAYMSLEQLKGEPADARTDQYSLCASLHEAIYGMRPYEGRTPGSLMNAMLEGRRAAPTLIEGTRRLRRAIWRGLSLDPAARWPTMDALIAELEAITRRRRWWSAAVTLGVGAVLGGGLALTRSQQAPCPDADATLDGTWGEDHRRRVTQAFAQHGPEDAEILLPRITERLDEYARAWGGMTHESCVATFVTHRQSEALFDLRARCLERRRNRVASAIDALAEADDPARLVQSAILPFKLPELAPCADVDALADRRAASEELSLHDGHGELRRRIDQADTLRDSGQFERALALAEAARDEAATLDAPLLHAEALECLGRIQAEGGPMREAKPTLEQAIVEANRVADDEIAARAWLSLLYVGAMRGDLDEAEHRVLGATAAVERVGDALLHAWLLNDLGILASEKEDFDAAEQYLEEALELKARTLGEQHVDVGVAWFNLGMMHSTAEQARAAREPMTRALSIFEATVGGSHPLTAYALSGLCSVELALEDFSTAVELCERVIARFESSPVAPMWEGRTRFTMAKALWELGRRDEARDMARRAAQVIAPEDPEHAKWMEEWSRNHEPGVSGRRPAQ